MIGTWTGYDSQHEAARQSAYIIVRDFWGTEAWFEDEWDTMRGDVALAKIVKIRDAYLRRWG